MLNEIWNPFIETVIKCPHCGVEQQATMTLTGKKIAHDCRFCNQTMYAKKGECCVFCSFGAIKCLGTQEKERLHV